MLTARSRHCGDDQRRDNGAIELAQLCPGRSMVRERRDVERRKMGGNDANPC